MSDSEAGKKKAKAKAQSENRKVQQDSVPKRRRNWALIRAALAAVVLMGLYVAAAIRTDHFGVSLWIVYGVSIVLVLSLYTFIPSKSWKRQLERKLWIGLLGVAVVFGFFLTYLGWRAFEKTKPFEGPNMWMVDVQMLKFEQGEKPVITASFQNLGTVPAEDLTITYACSLFTQPFPEPLPMKPRPANEFASKEDIPPKGNVDIRLIGDDTIDVTFAERVKQGQNFLFYGHGRYKDASRTHNFTFCRAFWFPTEQWVVCPNNNETIRISD